MLTKSIAQFMTKNGRKVEIHLPSLERTDQLLTFINRLTREDTYLSLTGKPKTYQEEENWIKSTILNMKSGQTFACWAVVDNKIIGNCDINRGGTRDHHVGKIGLMIDEDFRREGIGQFMLEFVLKQAQKMKIKIAALDVFADNFVAIKLYKKLGFKKFAHLPKGFFRKGKYSDAEKMYLELSSYAKATEDK